MGGGWLFLQRRRHPCQFPCLSLSCLIPPPSLQSPSSLAPALLMIPRQEAALAWGSKVISLVFLCRFLLFLCHCLSLKPSSLENQWHPLITISIKVEHERNWLEYQTLLCLYFFFFFALSKYATGTIWGRLPPPCQPPLLLSMGLCLPLQIVCQHWITRRYLRGHRTFKTCGPFNSYEWGLPPRVYTDILKHITMINNNGIM